MSCCRFLPQWVIPFAFGFTLASADAQSVHVSRFWHNHQPTYWPEWNAADPGGQNSRVQYAGDSIRLKPGQNYGGLSPNFHPENNLPDIFGNHDRVNAYQSGPRNSLSSIASEGGFALSYSGSLIDGVRQLGGSGQLGYGGGWAGGNREARGWFTPSGSRRLDLVGFTYHHSLAPLLPKSVLRKEVQIFKQAYWKAWNGNANLSDHSKGFFPTEMAFSRHIIDVLADEGYEWVIVPSHHISRTCPTYNTKANPAGSYNIFSSPPNKADQIGPSPTDGWWYGEPNPGNAAWNVSPYAYQLHKVKYVNPETGAEKSMIAVPSDDVLSYRFGYANEGIGKIQQFIAPYVTPQSRPVIVMPSTDGDNAWGGGSSSWFEATPQFFNDANNAGYRRNTPQDFVNAHGTNAPYAHIEDGAWIFPEMCYGSPYFLKWIEPPVANTAIGATNRYPGTQVDMETPGFALKFYSYAPLMAGANWCETAEQVLRDEGGTVEAWKIQAPYDWNGTWSSPNDVELAWHIYLHGLDSGFNYYGGLGNDDEVKPGLATRRAVEKLQPWMTQTRRDNDRTAPTVLKPQRFPYNPGGYTFGWFNRIPGGDERFLKKMPSEFYIWTHAYDLSGIPANGVSVRIRVDADGSNPLASNQNETFAGGNEVGSWITIPMTRRELPKTRAALNAAASNSQIDYFLPTNEVADYYFARISNDNVANFRGKLLDYYIEAVDSRGNLHKSEIQHVFVEDDAGGGGGTPEPSPVVSISPANPTDGQAITITYNPAGRNLASAPQVYLHVGRNGWQNRVTPRSAMTLADGKWTHTINAWPGTTVLDVVFTGNAEGQNSQPWDNNSGQDWHFAVTPAGDPGPPPSPPTGLSAAATGHTSIRIDWSAAAGADEYIIYRNGEEIGVTASLTWNDSGLTPSTSYAYTVAARNAAGTTHAAGSVQATTSALPLPDPEPIPFVMDGIADFPAYRLSNPGMTLYAAVRGDLLYVATWAPGPIGNDHFIIVGNAALASPTTQAPWGKAGNLAVPLGSPFLAAESSNGYISWFQSNGAPLQSARTANEQMEGVIDLKQAFGSIPTHLHLSALAYQTADNGILGAQAPAMILDNGNLDSSELLAIPLEALRDEDADGTYDRLQPDRGFVVTSFGKNAGNFQISWNCFPGRSYRIQSSPSLTGSSWTDVEGSEFTAAGDQLEATKSVPVNPSESRRFYRVALVP